MDVDLNAKGSAEARRGGELLVESGLLPDVVHTSLLRRAIRTAEIALNAADRLWIQTKRSWRLNERHYGALQGKDKAATLAEFGEEQFMTWRRSYDVPPPPIDNDNEYANFNDPRYAGLPTEARPRTECLKDVLLRALPYWYDDIVPDLMAGKVTLVAAHGNSLRAIVKHLDQISDEAVVGLNIPTGIPLVYELDDDLKPTETAVATWTPRPPRPPSRQSRTRARSSCWRPGAYVSNPAAETDGLGGRWRTFEPQQPKRTSGSPGSYPQIASLAAEPGDFGPRIGVMAVSSRESSTFDTRRPFNRADARAGGITLRELLEPQVPQALLRQLR